MSKFQKISIIDSHTGGEPTRVVIGGGPDLGTGSLAERRARFAAEHDTFRSALVNEPRGADPFVGALLCAPTNPQATTGVIFFNNVGYLGMCGHGTIGLLVTLHHLGQIMLGVHVVETPVGMVTATLHSENRVTVRNVASYRTQKSVAIEVPGYGPMTGDVAYGGNWFFLVNDHGQVIEKDNIEALTACSWEIRNTLHASGITGDNGAEIDHIELFGPAVGALADSRNFVLCPGGAYDRSPCGTGTSAKVACRYADGLLAPGEIWRQESVIGSQFEAHVEVVDGQVFPHITGSAFITAEATVLLDVRDDLAWGIRA